MKYLLPILVVAIVSVNVTAQDLWLRPEKYFWEPNQGAQIHIVTGKDFIAEPARTGISFTKLELIHRNERTDIRRKFTDGKTPFISVNLASDGLYLIAGAVNPESLIMSRADFLSYAEEFELENILRDSASIMSDPITVQLTRYLKACVRVGKAHDKSPEQSDKLPLEIIPDKNPLLLSRGERITFTVLRNGKPAFGVRVKIWNRWDNRTTLQHIYTEQDGTVNTTISSPGDWMVSVVDCPGERQGTYLLNSFCLFFGYR